MEELIAKRYIKAMSENANKASIQNIASVFSVLADFFKDKKFVQIIDNPNVSANDKSEILLEAVASADSSQVNNLIKLLVENKRINIIPAIAKELNKEIARSTKTYEGLVYSDTKITVKTMKELSDGLGKRFDSKISLTYVKDDFDGIKVDVEDLGIEINFSKSRIDSQIIEHIVKAI
ncbi:MAG: F0F1 ATP synthase subunit delta [Helicobacteraceae bacterium]|nr:F0F1 ATP synthase subunit delta [Candidatus Sulfurimonas ponti]MBL6973273.1 F0F1 ATP synthase subunit delta [Sulfurimonas sp.]